MAKMTQVDRVLNGVTETTTSQALNIENVDRVSFVFKRSDHSSGSSKFEVLVSVDGTNYITYNKLIDNVANTNEQDLTRVNSKTLGSDTEETVSMCRGDVYKYLKVKVTETTDGTHDAWVVTQR